MNGPSPQEFATYGYAKLWLAEGHVLSDSKREFPNPKVKMNEQEQQLETGIQYIFENEDAGKNLRPKSLPPPRPMMPPSRWRQVFLLCLTMESGILKKIKVK